MGIKTFRDLDVWKESHLLTLLVYKITKIFPKSEVFGLIPQLRRAAVSVESCIAEGFFRFHYKERLKFYYDSRGSLAEIQTQLIISYDLHYLSQTDFDEILKQSEKVSVILGGLIRSTNKRAQSEF